MSIDWHGQVLVKSEQADAVCQLGANSFDFTELVMGILVCLVLQPSDPRISTSLDNLPGDAGDGVTPVSKTFST
jgi:hypothetical protein